MCNLEIGVGPVHVLGHQVGSIRRPIAVDEGRRVCRFMRWGRVDVGHKIEWVRCPILVGEGARVCRYQLALESCQF